MIGELGYVTIRVLSDGSDSLSMKAETDFTETSLVVDVLKKAVTLLDQDTPDEVETRSEETTVETYRSKSA